jgi:hypothetical protein
MSCNRLWCAIAGAAAISVSAGVIAERRVREIMKALDAGGWRHCLTTSKECSAFELTIRQFATDADRPQSHTDVEAYYSLRNVCALTLNDIRKESNDANP